MSHLLRMSLLPVYFSGVTHIQFVWLFGGWLPAAKTRVSLIQMYQYWRVALPDIVVSQADMSKLYIGFLGVSRSFSGVSNSRILRQVRKPG